MMEPIKQFRRVCLDHPETSSVFPLFLCNDWDQVSQKEADSIKNHVVSKFREYWPEIDPDSQIIYISSPDATNDGTIVAEFASLMDAIKSTALQNNKATLQMQWRYVLMTIEGLKKLREDIMDLICILT